MKEGENIIHVDFGGNKKAEQEVTPENPIDPDDPANYSKECDSTCNVPTIGFLAHLDTSPDLPGENVFPQIINDYQGGDIQLPKNNVVIKLDENPELAQCVNDTIVTADGTTLLGVDDKAGIAAIMTAIKYLLKNIYRYSNT